MPLDQKTIIDAIEEAKESSKERNFTQSIELILNLREVDVKTAKGRIRERIELPNPLSEKANKICVIATGELALKAKKAGANQVLGKDEITEMAGNKKELKNMADENDFFLAEGPLMPLVGKILGSTLGPRGKMPVPVSPATDIADLINRYRRMVSVRARNQPVLQCRVGTEKMEEEDIEENVQAVLRVIERKLERGMRNIDSIYVKTTMGPSVRVV